MKRSPHPLSKLTLVALLAAGVGACATPPTKEVISTKDAPAAIGPYSQAIRFGITV